MIPSPPLCVRLSELTDSCCLESPSSVDFGLLPLGSFYHVLIQQDQAF